MLILTDVVYPTTLRAQLSGQKRHCLLSQVTFKGSYNRRQVGKQRIYISISVYRESTENLSGIYLYQGNCEKEKETLRTL